MKLIEIYDGTLFECLMIKNMLENEGVESMLKDEITGSRALGWKPGGAVKILVNDTDFSKARAVVMEFEKSRDEE